MNTLLLHILLLLLSAGMAVAALEKPIEHKNFELLNDVKLESELQGSMRVEKLTQIPRAIYRPNYRARLADPQGMAREYLSAKAALLQHVSPLSDISYLRTVPSLTGTRVQFVQTIEGHPVYNASIKVSINKDSEVVFVTNGYQPIFQLSNQQKIDEQTAISVASQYLRFSAPSYLEKAELIVYPEQLGHGRWAYDVTLVPGGEHYGDWEVLVDAETGDVFRVEDKACYYDALRETGSAWVFDPDPVTAARTLYGQGQFSDFGDSDNDSLTAYLKEVILEDINFQNGLYQLNGPYAAIIDVEAPFTGLHSQDSAQFHFTRSQDEFEAVNVYYHVSKTMSYLNDTLQFDVMPYQYGGGVHFDPRALNGDVNAYFSSGTGWVAFGAPSGRVDAGEDQAIIIHEMGHAIHDWITVGGLSQVDGLSEGLGDYWAQSYARSLGLFEPSDVQYDYFGVWGLQSWGAPSLRVTNFPNHYPEGLGGEVHYDGQLWSSSLMSIFDAIGKTATDMNTWESISMTDGNTNQVDAAFAFLQADIDLHEGANLPGIVPVFVDRGYLPGPLIPRIDADTTGGEGPLTVNFSDESFVYLAPISSYSWDFDGDGVTDSHDPNPSYTYTEPGIYSVSLTISDGSNSASITETDFISVNDGILVYDGREQTASVRDYSGLFIQDELSQMGVTSVYSNRLWSSLAGYDAVFVSLGNLGEQGDRGTILGDKEINALVDYLSNGGKVYIEGGSLMGGVLMFGMGDHLAFWNLFGVAMAEFNFVQHDLSILNGQPGSVGENLTFNGSTQVNSWYIDDLAANDNGTIVFSEPGYGNVAVQGEGIHGQKTVYSAYNIANLVDGELQNTRRHLLLNILEFFDTPLLVPAFSASVTGGHAPLVVAFEDESGANPAVTSWAWDFDNDGVVDSEEANPTWIYDEPGDYSVSLTIGNGENEQSTTVETAIRVFDGETALQFRDNEHAVMVAPHASLNSLFELSIEAWINPSDFGDEGDGDGRIVDKGYYRLFLNSTGSSTYPDSTLCVIIKHEDGTLSKTSAHANDIDLNVWQHVAVTYDGIDTELHIYINGVDRTLIHTAPSSIIKDHADKDLVIGNNVTLSKGFQGRIDELRIWETARSEEQIRSAIDGTLGGAESDLVAYYQMNEAHGNLLMDGSSNENHGGIAQASWEYGTTFLVPLAIQTEIHRPVDQLLVGNYPNPFNGSTQIRYALPLRSHISLQIFNLRGELLFSEVKSDQPAGWYALDWNGILPDGAIAPTGIYFFRIVAGSETQTLKMLMLK